MLSGCCPKLIDCQPKKRGEPRPVSGCCWNVSRSTSAVLHYLTVRDAASFLRLAVDDLLSSGPRHPLLCGLSQGLIEPRNAG